MNQNKDEILIREIQQKDISQMSHLLNNLSDQSKQFFHPHAFDKKTLTQITTNTTDHYYVLLLKDKIIGYSFLRLFGYQIPSFGCCIHRDYQKKGYATKLACWTIQKAQAHGYPKVILKVYKANTTAVQLYKKIGFTITSVKEDTEEIIMEYRF